MSAPEVRLTYFGDVMEDPRHSALQFTVHFTVNGIEQRRVCQVFGVVDRDRAFEDAARRTIEQTVAEGVGTFW